MPSISNSSRRSVGVLEIQGQTLSKEDVSMMDVETPQGEAERYPAVPLASTQPTGLQIEHLPDGPFLNMTEYLDTQSLAKMDQVCKNFRQINRDLGPWKNAGIRSFRGMEIEGEVFNDGNKPTGSNEDPEEGSTILDRLQNTREKKVAKLDWKTRYVHFKRELPKFRSPFDGSILTDVKNSDEVSYCNCRFRTDLLQDSGIYLEVQVYANADNLSLAVVDFDEGGKSSVTFSPDTGAVIKETKIQETPRKVKGWYIQPLRHIPPKVGTSVIRNERFEGIMGLYVKQGKIAFFRKFAHGDSQEWETTGFVIGLDWVHGRKITPCLAFRDEGPYHVCVNKISQDPPIEPEKFESAWDIKNWQELNWEGDNLEDA